jgi:hypothetical protein
MDMANTTQYQELVDIFFNKIKDYDLANMDEDIATEIAISYIDSACSQFQSCTQDLDNRDDELGQFGIQLSNMNKQMLVNYMCIEFIDSNFLRVSQALKSRLSTSDFHSLQNPQQISKVMELRSMLKSENDQLAINKSYKNSKLFELVTNRKKV